MRIINRKRFIISMSIIFIFCLSLFSFINSKVFSYTEVEYNTITVSEGDTLWNIAQKGSGNIQENIYEIKKLNNLDSSEIYVGQSLILPFAY